MPCNVSLGPSSMRMTMMTTISLTFLIRLAHPLDAGGVGTRLDAKKGVAVDVEDHHA
jgi:hypothetical protein